MAVAMSLLTMQAYVPELSILTLQISKNDCLKIFLSPGSSNIETKEEFVMFWSLNIQVKSTSCWPYPTQVSSTVSSWSRVKWSVMPTTCTALSRPVGGASVTEYEGLHDH